MIRNFIFILILICGNLSAAANEDSLSTGKTKSDFCIKLKSDSLFSFKAKSGVIPFFFHSMGAQAVAPFHMNQKQIWRTAGVLALTAALIHFDMEIDKVFKPLKEKNKFLSKFTPEFTELGDYYGYALVAGIAGVSTITREYRPFHASVLAAQAALTAGIWVRAGKILTSRMRPGATYNDINYNSDHWFGPFAQFNPKYNKVRGVAAFDAFPSGHTAAAFAMATIFAKEYSEYKAVPPILYSLAGLVAVSRLIQHDHWASDLLPGAAIGYLCADQVFKYDKQIRMGRTTGLLNIYPSFDQVPQLTIRWAPN